jgi:hypothetical protein
MKEYGQHKSKAQEDYEKHKDHLIDKKGDYVCSIPACQKVWYPKIEDVNRKRPSCYYKLCSACRMKSYLKGLEYKKNKGNNFNAMYPNTKIVEEEGQYA